jgi:hypothetical protein
MERWEVMQPSGSRTQGSHEETAEQDGRLGVLLGCQLFMADSPSGPLPEGAY